MKLKNEVDSRMADTDKLSKKIKNELEVDYKKKMGALKDKLSTSAAELHMKDEEIISIRNSLAYERKWRMLLQRRSAHFLASSKSLVSQMEGFLEGEFDEEVQVEVDDRHTQDREDHLSRLSKDMDEWEKNIKCAQKRAIGAYASRISQECICM